MQKVLTLNNSIKKGIIKREIVVKPTQNTLKTHSKPNISSLTKQIMKI